ncbi:hypothetical protein [Clostridium sp.]|uniref:hypothetical protein n=1 Tax=Clostridium sp. TaxID=1506 RepID=UPI003457C5B6
MARTESFLDHGHKVRFHIILMISAPTASTNKSTIVSVSAALPTNGVPFSKANFCILSPNNPSKVNS